MPTDLYGFHRGIPLPSYPIASLPPAGTAGRVARVTDDVGGIFRDTGVRWLQEAGNVINILEKGTDATALQAAHDSLPSTGGTILIPSNTTIALGTTRVNFSKNIVLMGFGWTSKITADVTGLANPGGNDLGILNIRHPTSGSALDYVKIYNIWFDFGGSRASTYAEGRRGLNIYRANNIDVRGNQFKGGVAEMVGFGNMDTPTGSRAWVIGNFFTDFAQDGLNPNSTDPQVIGNTFVTGSTPIEAGRSGVVIADNHIEDMTGILKISSVASFTVTGNRFKTVATTDTGSVQGVIQVAGGGANEPSTDGVIAGNTILNSATYANQVGINIIRGTSTIDNARISVRGNTVNGIRNGIQIGSLLDGDLSGNILVGTGVGAGINLAVVTQVKRVSVSDNNVRNFAARAVGITTNGPIQDQTAEVDANVVGWNTQENTLVLGISGRIDFANLDATPSVRRPSRIYYVANSGATTITQLDDGAIGQEVTLIFDDANTTISDAGNFLLNGAFTSTAGDTLTLVAQFATLWVEKSRSVN